MAGQLWVTSSQGQRLYSPLLMEEVLAASQPELKFLQFCEEKEAFGKNKGETFVFDKYGDVDNASTAGASNLTETSTIPSGSVLIYQGTGTLRERGISIPFTRKYTDLAQIEARKPLVNALSDHYAKQTDADVEAQFNACKIRYVGTTTSAGTFTTNGTATLTCTSAFNNYHVQNMVDYLYGTMKAKPYDGDNYVAICCVAAKNAIYNAVEGIMKYTKYPATGEFGRYYDCRFVKTNSAAMTNLFNTSYSGEVYMFGKSTVMYGMAVPMQVIPKEETDYRRSRGVAWYDICGFKIKHEGDPDNTIVKWDSAA